MTKLRLSMKLLWEYHLKFDYKRTAKNYKPVYPCDCASFLAFVKEEMKHEKN